MVSAKPIKINNPVCSVCKKPAKIYSDNKWWCSVGSDMGEFNLLGFCKEKKK
jgi:hypothetical protein